jgi:hypothetical protein
VNRQLPCHNDGRVVNNNKVIIKALFYIFCKTIVEVFACAGARKGASDLLDPAVSSRPGEMSLRQGTEDGTLGVMPVFPDGTAKDTGSSGYHRKETLARYIQ